MNIFNCLKSFITTANYQSISTAARKLFVSPSKLSKEIRWLEGKYKMKLFIRSTRRLTLTESGELLYEKAVKLLEDLEQLQNIQKEDPNEWQGMLRIYQTVTPVIPYFVDLSIQFMHQHPKIDLTWLVAGEVVPLGESFFDVAISLDRPRHPSYLCKLLFKVNCAVFCSPSYIEKRGRVQTVEQLLDHNCLVDTLYSLQNKWIFSDKIIEVTGNFQSNNASILKQAAVAGLGLIWAPAFSVRKELEQGQLVSVLSDELCPELPLYYMYPKYTANANGIEALIKFYKQQAVKDNFAIP